MKHQGLGTIVATAGGWGGRARGRRGWTGYDKTKQGSGGHRGRESNQNRGEKSRTAVAALGRGRGDLLGFPPAGTLCAGAWGEGVRGTLLAACARACSQLAHRERGREMTELAGLNTGE